MKEILNDNCVVVVLRNGMIGTVVNFNGKPSHLILKSYCNPISKYNDELKHKNNNYDIMEIYDGSTIEDVDSVFKPRFEVSELNLIWKREA